MSRRVLPQRRQGLRFDIEHGGIDFNVMTGVRDDGSLAEIFVSAHRKVGTGLMAATRDAAILMSLLLQHGCPAATIASAITREDDGSPASTAGAVIDAVIQSKEEPAP